MKERFQKEVALCYVKEWKEIGKSRTKFKVSTTAKGIKDRQAIDYKTGERRSIWGRKLN